MVFYQSKSFLFERFRQAEGSENRSYEGTGLGLALVKELVELHGGKVTVESVYGQGTTFRVWLIPGSSHFSADQVSEAAVEVNTKRAVVELADLELLEEKTRDSELGSTEAAEVEEESLTNSSPSILVVDDNPDLRAYVSGILRANGYHVRTIVMVQKGLDLLRKFHPA